MDAPVTLRDAGVAAGQPHAVVIPQGLIDKHREFLVSDDWYQDVYDGFIDDMRDVGIWVDTYYRRYSLPGGKHAGRDEPDIRFDLWSQGETDFAGYIHDWPLFLTKHGLVGKYPMIEQPHVYEDLAFSASREHNWRGGVAYALTCEHMLPLDTPFYDELNNMLEDECISAEKDFKDAFRQHGVELRKRLEAEYEHLTSDDTIEEGLRANYTDEELVAMIAEYEDKFDIAA